MKFNNRLNKAIATFKKYNKSYTNYRVFQIKHLNSIINNQRNEYQTATNDHSESD